MLAHMEEAQIQIEALSCGFRLLSRPSTSDSIFLYHLYVIDLRQGRPRIHGTSVEPLYMFVISRVVLTFY